MNFNREWCGCLWPYSSGIHSRAFTRFPVPCQRLLISSHDVAVLFPSFGFCKDFIHVCPARRYAILPSKPRDFILSELHSYRIDLLSLFPSTLHTNPENYQLFIKPKPPFTKPLPSCLIFVARSSKAARPHPAKQPPVKRPGPPLVLVPSRLHASLRELQAGSHPTMKMQDIFLMKQL